MGLFSRWFPNKKDPQVEKAERVLLDLLKVHAPQGRVVDLPEDVLTNPRKSYLAVAAQNLVDKHPNVTIQRFQSRLSLVYRSVQEATVGKERVKELDPYAFNAQPGDDPGTTFDPENVADAHQPGRTPEQRAAFMASLVEKPAMEEAAKLHPPEGAVQFHDGALVANHLPATPLSSKGRA